MKTEEFFTHETKTKNIIHLIVLLEFFLHTQHKRQKTDRYAQKMIILLQDWRKKINKYVNSYDSFLFIASFLLRFCEQIDKTIYFEREINEKPQMNDFDV